MKEEMAPLKKLQELCRENLTKSQNFIKYSNLDEWKMNMRLKTRMLDIAGDVPGKYKGNEGCVGCSPGAMGEVVHYKDEERIMLMQLGVRRGQNREGRGTT